MIESLQHCSDSTGILSCLWYDEISRNIYETYPARCCFSLPQQVVKVNNDWEKFWNRKKTTFDRQIKEKDAVITDLQKSKDGHKECGKTSSKGSDTKTSDGNSGESEEVSMLTREHVHNLEVCDRVLENYRL